jgi:hypothetical protein
MSPAETNQANAKHSTGPKTKAGKKKSSLNALRHGLTAQLVVMPTEDVDAYVRHLASFNDEYRPVGATESQLVRALADASWRLNRVVALEAHLLASPSDDPYKALATLSLHSQRLSRQFEKTVAQLRGLQQTRRAQEKHDPPPNDGFVFSKPQTAPRPAAPVPTFLNVTGASPGRY